MIVSFKTKGYLGTKVLLYISQTKADCNAYPQPITTSSKNSFPEWIVTQNRKDFPLPLPPSGHLSSSLFGKHCDGRDLLLQASFLSWYLL